MSYTYSTHWHKVPLEDRLKLATEWYSHFVHLRGEVRMSAVTGKPQFHVVLSSGVGIVSFSRGRRGHGISYRLVTDSDGKDRLTFADPSVLVNRLLDLGATAR